MPAPRSKILEVESQKMQLALDPFGLMSTQDYQRAIRTHTQLRKHLEIFAEQRDCPYPFLWAQAAAFTLTGHLKQLWDMPNGDPSEQP